MSPGILVALDNHDLDTAIGIAQAVRGHVSGFKVGLGLLLGPDPNPIERVAELGLPVFADAKMHDIPAQVERAAQQLGRRGARWVTAHASGGQEMLKASVHGLAEGSGGSGGILGVSVLTSLDVIDLPGLGMPDDVATQVHRLVGVASSAGVEGIVCAVDEVGLAKSIDDTLIAVTPGIRPSDVASHDQKRTGTVEAAILAGSDYLVVGRAITDSADPEAAAQRIFDTVRDTAV